MNLKGFLGGEFPEVSPRELGRDLLGGTISPIVRCSKLTRNLGPYPESTDSEYFVYVSPRLFFRSEALCIRELAWHSYYRNNILNLDSVKFF